MKLAVEEGNKLGLEDLSPELRAVLNQALAKAIYAELEKASLSQKKVTRKTLARAISNNLNHLGPPLDRNKIIGLAQEIISLGTAEVLQMLSENFPSIQQDQNLEETEIEALESEEKLKILFKRLSHKTRGKVIHLLESLYEDIKNKDSGVKESIPTKTFSLEALRKKVGTELDEAERIILRDLILEKVGVHTSIQIMNNIVSTRLSNKDEVSTTNPSTLSDVLLELREATVRTDPEDKTVGEKVATAMSPITDRPPNELGSGPQSDRFSLVLGLADEIRRGIRI